VPETVTFEDVLRAGEQWLQDNVPEDLLRQLQERFDPEQAQQFLREFQRRFQGDYVIDLAAWKAAARALIPVLEGQEQTRPYAAWLKARLDYFEVANEFRLSSPSPQPKPGQKPVPPPNPAPEAERKLWRRQVEQRPAPRGADVYVHRLKPVFTAEKVPPQLVWLAEVESAFEPRARSPAGAAGMFQLMPATAQRFGLSLKPRDQRLDPVTSGRAAAQYLRALYGEFKDWRVALAAYNAGEGRVRSLLTRNKTRRYDPIATKLPAETQMYVPKVEAVVQRREGVLLGDLRLPSG
jgi:membrane-bound lytic murein transglycosylase D